MIEQRFNPKKLKNYKIPTKQNILLDVLRVKDQKKQSSSTETRSPQKGNKIRTILIFCIIAFIITVFLRAFIFQMFVVPSNSMSPILGSQNILMVNKFDFGVTGKIINKAGLSNKFPKKPKRYDLIVYQINRSPGYAINRVMGMPGDQVKMKKGILYINGRPYKKIKWDKGVSYESIKLSSNAYFAIGDNGKVISQNIVLKRRIIGICVFRIWPLQKLGKIK